MTEWYLRMVEEHQAELHFGNTVVEEYTTSKQMIFSPR